MCIIGLTPMPTLKRASLCCQYAFARVLWGHGPQRPCVPISPRKASYIFQDIRFVRSCISMPCIQLSLFPHILGISQEVLRCVNGWELSRPTVRKSSGRTVPKIPIRA